MAWWHNLLPKQTLNLTQTDRNLIFKLFGSFRANQIGSDPNGQIEHGYEGNVDVYSIISKVVQTLKSVPTIVEQRSGDSWEVINNTSIHELMESPNVSKGYTWDDIEEQRAVYLLASGDNFMIGNTQIDSTMIEEVDILPSPQVLIESTQDFFMPQFQYRFELGTTRRTFDRSQVQHVRNFNPGYNTVQESLRGLSIIQVARSVVRVGNARWDANAALIEQKGALGMVTDKSNRPMTNPEAKAVQGDFDGRANGLGNQGKVVVTNKDLNFIKMAMSPADLQLVESGVITLRAICNLYGVDSSLFNDPANKTFNNRLEAEKALFTNVIMPMAKKIDEADTMFIAKNHFPAGNVRMRKDFSGVDVLQKDNFKKAQSLTLMKTSGILTTNQVLQKLGEPMSTDENADKLIISANQMLLDDLEDKPSV